MSIRYVIPVLFALVFIGGIYKVVLVIIRKNKVESRNWPGQITPPESGEIDQSVFNGLILALLFLTGGAGTLFTAVEKVDSNYQVLGGCLAVLVGLYMAYKSLFPQRVRWDETGFIITTGFNRHAPSAKQVLVPWSEIARIEENEGNYTLALRGLPRSGWITFDPDESDLIFKLHQMRPDLVNEYGEIRK